MRKVTNIFLPNYFAHTSNIYSYRLNALFMNLISRRPKNVFIVYWKKLKLYTHKLGETQTLILLVFFLTKSRIKSSLLVVQICQLKHICFVVTTNKQAASIILLCQENLVERDPRSLSWCLKNHFLFFCVTYYVMS